MSGSVTAACRSCTPNRRHQHYCSALACGAASKAASQARWLAKPENQSYFRGPVNVARVQAWRSRHPGYWRKGRRVDPALQEVSMAQIGSAAGTDDVVGSPLQELLLAQPAVLIGLIAHLVGTPLQDDIVRATDRLLRLGQDIGRAQAGGIRRAHSVVDAFVEPGVAAGDARFEIDNARVGTRVAQLFQSAPQT